MFFRQWLKLYISSVKLAGFAGSGVKMSFNLRGGTSAQGPIIIIFSGSCSTLLFDSFGPGVKIRINTRDDIFPKKTHTVHFKSQTCRFCWSGVQISFNPLFCIADFARAVFATLTTHNWVSSSEQQNSWQVPTSVTRRTWHKHHARQAKESLESWTVRCAVQIKNEETEWDAVDLYTKFKKKFKLNTQFKV